jgi:hypothetical protein
MSAPSPPSFVADFDSASAMTRAIAAFLHGEDFPALGNPPALQPIAAAANVLPQRLREKLFIAGGATEAVDPDAVGDLDLDAVGRWTEEIYPSGPFPVVAIGSSSGAGTMLQAALGAPFLPQTVFVPVGQRVHPDDPQEAMERGLEPGAALMRNNPDWQLHHMHDANQDRLMVRALTYFRVKRRRLGPHYERILRERLRSGGTILLLECDRRWRTTRISDRHVFQHGAVGGATEEEFHRGGPRVAEYLERYDSPVRQWHGPEPDTESPEAEWGFEHRLRDDVTRFAEEHGYRVVRVRFDDPHALSPFVADLYRGWYERRGLLASRLWVQSFIALDPYWTLRTGSVPFWMRFNMEPSLELVRDYLRARSPFDDVHLALFQHGVEAVGLPDGQRWRTEVLDQARRSGTTLGADLDEFPLDFAHYGRYHRRVKEIPARYPLPAPLPVDELFEVAHEPVHEEQVRIDELTTAHSGRSDGT